MTMKSDRDKICDELSSYLDGELPAEQAARVERALAADSELARQRDQLQAVRAHVRSLPRVTAGDDFVQRVLERCERNQLLTGHTDHVHGRRHWGRYVAAAAAVVLLAGTALLLTTIFNYSPFDTSGVNVAGNDGDAITAGDELAAGNTRGEPASGPDTARGRIGGEGWSNGDVDRVDIGRAGYDELIAGAEGRETLAILNEMQVKVPLSNVLTVQTANFEAVREQVKGAMVNGSTPPLEIVQSDGQWVQYFAYVDPSQRRQLQELAVNNDVRLRRDVDVATSVPAPASAAIAAPDLDLSPGGASDDRAAQQVRQWVTDYNRADTRNQLFTYNANQSMTAAASLEPVLVNLAPVTKDQAKPLPEAPQEEAEPGQ
jgi:hypothetical protein